MDKLVKFFQEAYAELKLSSWLTRREMFGSTVVVVVLTLIVAVYVAFIDRILLFFSSIFLRIR